jgi:transcriptional regulator with XRE-family HTH domain
MGHRERQKAYGRWNPDRVPADPVRAHLATLKAAGLSYRRIVELAGIHRSYIGTLLVGKNGRPPAQYVSKSTADRILSVQVPADFTEVVRVARDGDRVPVIGARRRLQALVAAGWTMRELARQLGLVSNNFGPLMHGDGTITAARHRQVVELFERLQMQPGPSSRARAYARKRRWKLPLEWDEDTIDEPDARPIPGSRRQIRTDRATA